MHYPLRLTKHLMWEQSIPDTEGNVVAKERFTYEAAVAFAVTNS